jgi:hypothetical protein
VRKLLDGWTDGLVVLGVAVVAVVRYLVRSAMGCRLGAASARSRQDGNNLAVLGDLDRACIEVGEKVAKLHAKRGSGDGTSHRLLQFEWPGGRVRRASAPYVVIVDPVAPEV